MIKVIKFLIYWNSVNEFFISFFCNILFIVDLKRAMAIKLEIEWIFYLENEKIEYK